MDWLEHHKIATIGTIVVLAFGFLVNYIGLKWISAHVEDSREHYRKRKLLSTGVTVLMVVVVILLWSRLLQHTGTFLGILGAGLAVALREPLLSIAGRIAIFAGHIYSVGDRIEIEKMSGDVIDIGFFYTRMMEIGNWISGDQYSGRIVQFPNSRIFGTAVFNYTGNFEYIWDEVQLNITYDSNLKAARQILLDAGGEYTQEFLQNAQRQLRQMKRMFLVPDFELDPQVYIKVTTNWLGLTMRYVVDPKKRRAATTFLYQSVFDRIRQRDDISIGTDTMEVTVKNGDEKPQTADQDKAA